MRQAGRARLPFLWVGRRGGPELLNGSRSFCAAHKRSVSTRCASHAVLANIFCQSCMQPADTTAAWRPPKGGVEVGPGAEGDWTVGGGCTASATRNRTLGTDRVLPTNHPKTFREIFKKLRCSAVGLRAREPTRAGGGLQEAGHVKSQDRTHGQGGRVCGCERWVPCGAARPALVLLWIHHRSTFRRATVSPGLPHPV